MEIPNGKSYEMNFFKSSFKVRWAKNNLIALGFGQMFLSLTKSSKPDECSGFAVADYSFSKLEVVEVIQVPNRYSELSAIW